SLIVERVRYCSVFSWSHSNLTRIRNCRAIEIFRISNSINSWLRQIILSVSIWLNGLTIFSDSYRKALAGYFFSVFFLSTCLLVFLFQLPLLVWFRTFVIH